MTLKELIERAIELAVAGLPGVDSAAVEIAAEAALPTVFGRVGERLAGAPNTRHLLRRVKLLAVVNGTVDLPDDVLARYACEASLYDPADNTKRYSLVDWSSLVDSQLDMRLGYFAMDNGVLTVVEPDSSYDPNSGPTLAVRLAIPCAPVVPAALATEIDVHSEVIDYLIEALAAALKPAIVTGARR